MENGPNMLEYVKYDDLINAASKEGKLVALSGRKKVKSAFKRFKQRKEEKAPTVNKGPAISWDKNPPKFKGLNDKFYGSGIVCDYYNTLKLHLVVIDIDRPKNQGDVSVKAFKKYFPDILNSTHCKTTPNGGLHIYFLSKKKPEARQPKINIDYQANTGTGRGKYVVANWIWDLQGNNKEYYNQLPGSKDDILIVNDSDKGLNHILEVLTEKGVIQSEEDKHLAKIIDVLSGYVREGERNKYACAIAGYFYKEGYPKETTQKIIEGVFREDEELKTNRLQVLEHTYRQPKNQVKGWSFLKEYLSKHSQDEIKKLTQGKTSDLKDKILQKLLKSQNPTPKLLADYVNQHLELYKNLNTLKFYEKLQDGGFKEINEDRIINFCNEHFGNHSISSKTCRAMLDYVTAPVEMDYNLIQFTNGILNTETREFTEDKNTHDKTPKLNLPFKWNPEATGNKIQEIINQILDNPKYPDDKELWFRAVGHAFMGSNRIGKMVIVTGPSRTGKSTLTTILQRLFFDNYSTIPTHTINDNQRFTLHSMIGAAVNIDDDINAGVLKNIGHLNTVTTGNGLNVEVKGENRTIKATNPEIPRLFANGNSLPPVLGEGFRTRLLLLHAENIIPADLRDDNLQNDILLGRYDQDMEWLIYTVITKYWEGMNKPLISAEMEERQEREYEFRSYPLKGAISAFFEDDFDNGDYLRIGEVNNILKKWSRWAYQEGKIPRDHAKPGQKQISQAMDRAGFYKALKVVSYDDMGRGIQERVYADIKLSKKGKELLKIIDDPQRKIFNDLDDMVT